MQAGSVRSDRQKHLELRGTTVQGLAEQWLAVNEANRFIEHFEERAPQ